MKIFGRHLQRNAADQVSQLTSINFAGVIKRQQHPMFQDANRWRPLIPNLFLVLFVGLAILRFTPGFFDYPAARAINNIATTHSLANQLATGATYPPLEGIILLSLVWYCWFSAIGSILRAHLLSGIMAAVAAGLVAILWQRMLPSTPKPIFDTILHIQAPDATAAPDDPATAFFSGSPSFPSERGTLFAGLAIALFLVQRRVGLLALACTAGIECCRIWLGLHYPTDVMGSFCLAAGIVWLAAVVGVPRLGIPFLRWEHASASTFYMCAFVASYQIAIAFQDVRVLLSQQLH
jgi:membrane-associated phospholipid phosphatase